MIVLQSLTRLLAFVGKELVEVVRRPGAIVSLILGPFLILAVFGMGYQGFRRPLQTIVVIPPQTGLPSDVQTYQSVSTGLQIVEVDPDPAEALQKLAARQVDAVIVAPADVENRFRSGQQSEIDVHINVVNPVDAAYASFLAGLLSSAVNEKIIEAAAEKGATYAFEAGQPTQIPPEVIAAPTRAKVVNDSPVQPNVNAFYGPAVLALILQHLAVTLVALSLVRERTTGIIELFRVSPISTWEVIVGKILAFGVLAALISVATVGLLVAGLHVPLQADPAQLAGILTLLTVAALALGLFIATISDSERQAVQLSLLVLLASVFFSGFVVAVEEFTPAVRIFSYLLPVTHGIRLTQDLMLRGWTNAGWEVYALGAIGGVLVLVTWFLLRRAMTRA